MPLCSLALWAYIISRQTLCNHIYLHICLLCPYHLDSAQFLATLGHKRPYNSSSVYPILRPLYPRHSLPLAGVGPDHKTVSTNRQCASKTDYKPKKNQQSPASLPTLVPPDPGRKLFFSYNEVDFNFIISFITHLLTVIYYTVTSENIYLKSQYAIYAWMWVVLR